jgi:hypothetical protein
MGKRDAAPHACEAEDVSLRDLPVLRLLRPIRDLEELRASLFVYYKECLWTWATLSVVAWLLPIFRLLKGVAPVYTVLSFLVLLILFKARKNRPAVLFLPIFILGIVAYWVCIVMAVRESGAAADPGEVGNGEAQVGIGAVLLVAVVLLWVIFHLSAELTFFFRAVRLIRGRRQ